MKHGLILIFASWVTGLLIAVEAGYSQSALPQVDRSSTRGQSVSPIAQSPENQAWSLIQTARELTGNGLPIVSYLANRGQFSEAIALNRQVGEQTDRARVGILKGYISTERFDEAFAFAKTVQDKTERSALLMLLAQWAWRSGRNDLAAQIANQIPESGRAQALAEVAFADAGANQQARAVQILTQAYQLARTQPGSQSFALWADYFAQVGAFDRALAIANGMSAYEKADAKVRIARTYANSNQLAKAIALIQQVRDGELQPFGDMPDLKVEGLYQIVRRALQAGQDDLAMRAVNALKRGQDRVKALRMVAHHYQKTNQLPKAIAALGQAVATAQTVDKLTVFYDRNTFFAVSNAGLLAEIAQDYSDLNQPERSLTALDQALNSARTLKEAHPSAVQQQVQYLAAIAKLYVQLGQRDRALAAAESAANLIGQVPGSDRSSVFPGWTVTPMAESAQIFYSAGANNQALEMLTSLRTVSTTISDIQQQLWGFIAITKAYAAIGAESQVKDTVETGLKRVESLEPNQKKWLTDRLIVASASSDPINVLRRVQTEGDRATQIPTLAKIAINYHALGKHTQAQTVVRQLQQVAAMIPDLVQREQLVNDVVIRSYFVPQWVRTIPIPQLIEAGEINTSLQSPQLKAYNWSRIAQAYAFQGRTEQARETMQLALDEVKKIRDRFEQSDLLWQLLEETLQAEEPRLASQIAMSFAVDSYRATALQRIQFKQATPANI